MAAIGLKSQIWNNNLRSMALLGLYPFLLMGIVWVIAAAYVGLIGPTMTGQNTGFNSTNATDFANGVLAAYGFPIFGGVCLWFCFAWLYNTKMLRMVTHAHPVTRIEEPELYNMLENLCIARGMAMPTLNIIESRSRNAFASGINDKTYTITLTRGLLGALQKDEVEAVLGHELTHIINRDVRLLMVCIIFTGMLGFCAQLVFTLARSGARVPSRRGSGHSGFLLFVIFGVLWLGYLASSLTRFALSRSREYMADAGSIELTHNPDAMMRALLRISGRDQIPEATADVAMMCIENTRPFLGLFATHPPIGARVQAIAAISQIPVPDITPHSGITADDRFQQTGGKEIDWIARSRQQKNPWR